MLLCCYIPSTYNYKGKVDGRRTTIASQLPLNGSDEVPLSCESADSLAVGFMLKRTNTHTHVQVGAECLAPSAPNGNA